MNVDEMVPKSRIRACLRDIAKAILSLLLAVALVLSLKDCLCAKGRRVN